MDAFDDPPLEVIRVGFQGMDLFNAACFLAFAVLSAAVALTSGSDRTSFDMFALLFLVLSAFWIVASVRTRVEIHRAGMVRRYRMRTGRYLWKDIDRVDVSPGHRLLNPRPLPALTLRTGERIELVELKTPFWVPWSSPALTPQSQALVDAVNLRIDHPASGPVEEAHVGVASRPPRAWIVGPLLVCVGLLLAMLAIALMVLPFVASTAHVDPSRLPPGRVYYGEPSPQGGTSYWVDCPRPVTAAFGSDPICQRDGRSNLRVSVVGLAFSAVVAFLYIWYVKALRRRYRRWNEAQAPLNA